MEYFVEFIDHACEGRPAKEDCRIFRFNINILCAGENKITISSRAIRDLEIERVNLGIWGR